MAAELDLSKAHLHRPHGDLLAIYSWINEERALILVPRYRKGAPWYCVLESAAFKYDDPAYLAKQCTIACNVLGIEPSKTNWVRVATIINEGLPDLIRMPHAPEKELEKAAIGAMKLMEDGQLVAAQDIHLETEGAATYA